MFEFKLPDLGEGIHEGELLKYYVQVDGNVKEDEPLMDVETDKAAVTIPSPRSGKVVSIKGKVGDTLHVGDVVVVIDDGSGTAVSAPAPAKEETPKVAEKPAEPKKAETVVAKAAPASAPAVKTPAVSAAATKPPVIVATKPADGRPVPAAPATRKLARELGVDINVVPGTGAGGRIMNDDVKAFASGGVRPRAATVSDDSDTGGGSFTGGATGIPFLEVEAMPDFEQWGPVEREAVRSIRRKVARKMTTSMILVPHVCHMDEADVTDLEDFRNAERNRRKGGAGEKLTLLPILMKAMTVLLKKYPQFNASLDPFREELIFKHYYNIGFAADTPRGLVVPVVKNVDQKSIIAVSDETVVLAGQAREGAIDASDMRGGTFTITNVGPIGGTGLIPTINYPEVAILGMARVQEKAVVRNGQIVIRKMLPITMTFDHRVADGAQAAYMVTELVGMLENPGRLAFEL